MPESERFAPSKNLQSFLERISTFPRLACSQDNSGVADREFVYSDRFAGGTVLQSTNAEWEEVRNGKEIQQ
jgi:hypothetical protein